MKIPKLKIPKNRWDVYTCSYDQWFGTRWYLNGFFTRQDAREYIKRLTNCKPIKYLGIKLIHYKLRKERT